MDAWGLIIAVVSVVLYFVTKKKYWFFILTTGIGIGLVIGGVWAMAIVNSFYS